MNRVRGYIFSRPFMGERVPQHVQNLVIRDYCDKNNLQFLLSATEYAMPNSSLILEQLLIDVKNISGLVAYSLFQLPGYQEARLKVYQSLMANGKTIYFAVEGLSAKKDLEFQKIETLWRIRQTMEPLPAM